MHSQCIFFFLSVFSYVAGASLLEPIIENVVHLQTALPPPDTPGIWRKKMIWKARWVKEWKQSKNWRPVWKKVWSPIEIREWLPIPRPPPPDITASISTSGGGPPDSSVYTPSGSPNHDGPPGSPIGPSHGQGPHGGPSTIYPVSPPSNGGPFGPPNGPFNGQGSQGGSAGPYSPGPSLGLSSGSSHSEPLSSYHPGSSTPLHEVSDDWPHPDPQELLSSYQTIKNPNDDIQFPKSERLPQPSRPPPTYNAPANQPAPFSRPDKPQQLNQPPKTYNAHAGNQGILAQFLEPPKASFGIQSSRPNHYSEPIKNETDSSKKPNTVSPYAAKLAQAVLREKFNQSLNPTERPSGLTEVVYKPNPTSTTAKPSSTPTRVTKSAGQSTTESSSNVYIVTPVALG